MTVIPGVLAQKPARGYAGAGIRSEGSNMAHVIREMALKSQHHTSFYLDCGPESGVPMIFVHGWPELSISWRHQLPVFAGLGFRAVAPDMRGYGRSSHYARHDDFTLEAIVADMIELLDALGAQKAIWVGHDWGSPVVWAIAQQHPGRCHGIASLCAPYLPEGLSVEAALPLADRNLYPVERFPAAQWDYMLFYRENFSAAHQAFDANVRGFVRLAFRAGDPATVGQPAMTAMVRAQGGWFGPGAAAPDLPRDPAVLTQADEDAYTEALTRSGFFGPDSWYMNAAANAAFAQTARANWRLPMPVLFAHAAYDNVCETLVSRLAEPMREHCANLTEVTVNSGHWMAQEQPAAVNAALAKWCAAQFGGLV
ncbi:MAG: alpha/beta fold hydrolase [Polymorphobacter sp.]